MTNGQYALTGGFWVLPQAEQSLGAPTLTIVPGASGNPIIFDALMFIDAQAGAFAKRFSRFVYP